MQLVRVVGVPAESHAGLTDGDAGHRRLALECFRERPTFDPWKSDIIDTIVSFIL